MDEEDEDLRAAIAASLAEHQRARQALADIVDLTEDDDDIAEEEDQESEEARYERELQEALEASKQEAAPSPEPEPEPIRTTSITPPAVRVNGSQPVIANTNGDAPYTANTSATASVSSFMSERAQLEQARLARQKRHLESTAPAAKRSRTVSPATSPTTSPPSSPEIQRSKPAVKAVDTTTPNHGLFWDGEIRQTGNAHVPQDPERPVFRMTDILSPTSDLEFVVLSSYCTDVAWLHKLIPEGIPLLLVVDPPEDLKGQAGLKNLGVQGWLRVIPRLWQARGVMHIKLMLLFYKSGRLRLVVPTANLVDYDWRDIENTVFLQDLPRLPDIEDLDRHPHEFPIYLWSVLHALNVPEGLANLVNTGYPGLPMQSMSDLQGKWDWGRVKAKLVASVAGNYEGWYEVRKYGHPRLSATIRALGAQPPRGHILTLECQGSSVGNYTTQYLNEMYKSCCGDDPIKWIDTPKSRLAKLPWPQVKVLYPTLRTVEESVFGRDGGGSFFCRKQYWSKAGAPRELFYDSRAKSGKVLMHTKMIVGTYKPSPLHAGFAKPTSFHTIQSKGKGKGKATETIVIDSDTEDEEDRTEDEEVEEVVPEAWVYVGSHNFTMAAWGSVSGSILAPKLNISNFELGVILPIRDRKQLDRIVPWVRPAPKYGRDDVPWMQDEHRDQSVPTWRQLHASA